MADDTTKAAVAVLNEVFDELELQFQARLDMVLESAVKGQGYYQPEPLKVDNVEDIIKITNDGMAAAAKNNNREEIRAVSRQGNLLMSLARDNYSASRDRLEQCRDHAMYVKRALNTAALEDPTQSEGMLTTGIRKVDL